jgi:predicted transcriptional regulator of viral defense system
MSEKDLLEITGAQHGYFTAAQAAAAGISRRALVGRARHGLIERIAYGLYRSSGYPSGPRDEFYALQTSVPTATFSHETALELYGLSDVLPRTIHVTVPSASGLKPRAGTTIHRSDLAPTERTLHDDLWVTDQARTFRDCARWGTDPEQLLAAFDAARERGMIGSEAAARLRSTYPFSLAAA